MSGCGPIQRYKAEQRQEEFQQQQANQREINKQRIAAMQQEAISCKNRREAGEFKLFVESSKCINEALEKGFTDINYPYMDLVSLLNATRLVVAEKIDHREVTEAQGLAEIAEKGVWLTDQEQKRDAQKQALFVHQQGVAVQQQAVQNQQSAQEQAGWGALTQLGLGVTAASLPRRGQAVGPAPTYHCTPAGRNSYDCQ